MSVPQQLDPYGYRPSKAFCGFPCTVLLNEIEGDTDKHNGADDGAADKICRKSQNNARHKQDDDQRVAEPCQILEEHTGFFSACTLLGPNRARREAASTEVRPERPEPICSSRTAIGSRQKAVFRRRGHCAQYNAYVGQKSVDRPIQT